MNTKSNLFQTFISKHTYILEMFFLNSPDYSYFSYSPATHKTYGTYDKNFTNRFLVMILLRFSSLKIETIEDLVRNLFIEELKGIEHNSFQGFGNIELATWLLKKYNNKDDILLFERAKNANFDTACGLDIGGIYHDYFSDSIDEVSVEEFIWLMIDLHEENLSDQALALWKNTQNEWNEKNLKLLASFEKSRKNPQTELQSLNKILELSRNKLSDWDFCSLLLNIAEKQVQICAFNDAWESIILIMPRLEKVENWHKFGLGRFIIETCMDIALGDNTKIIEVWGFSKTHVENMDNMHGNLCLKAAEVSSIVGDKELSKSLLKKYNTKSCI